jgi:hypothetical protein
MPTSEADCLAALREAAERLGESPTKAGYEQLGLTPASATIIRVVGGWNEAKERAGLETAPSTGSRVGSKPDAVALPDGVAWEDLSVDQRWHYRNVERNTERTLQRRARLRSWANERKREEGCRSCGEDDPGCLDFHHRTAAEKRMALTEMITHGYGRETLRAEIAKCDVLCANCHRIEHAGPQDDDGTDHTDSRDALQAWLRTRKAAAGCSHCGETDPRCLVFHHVDEKEAAVSQLVANGRPRAEIEAELERCTVLCANCHRKEHFEPPSRD